MVIDAAIDALVIIADPWRFMFVALGTLLGLMIGVIPGIGGLVGLALLLPFTFTMDPYTALAFLVGVQSVTTTSDTIPAVLFGVPGTTGSAATVLDGHPMAKRGEAGRAFGAAFTASVCGGLFGAVVLAVSIPVLRPFILSVGTPELLAICLLGLTLVATLSYGALMKGLIAAAVGLLLSTIGDEPQTGELRWTFDMLYLWDGLSLVPLALGLFAVPEIIDLGASRGTIAGDHAKSEPWQQMEGVRDAIRNWWLVLRCSAIGTLLGSIPGVGANVIDWVAYAFGARTLKGAAETFGKGDVRGVIASEASNNAKEGGALVPTLAFGVPGSASMALLLGAFLIHGLAPGPKMLEENLDITFTMIWSVALANIMGAGACFLFAGKFAKIATVRAGVLVPLVFAIMAIGAFQGGKDYGDLVTLLILGTLGWAMKRLNWPRAPMVLAFVLGGLVENYLFISHTLHGFDWMLRPVPLVVWAVVIFMFGRPLFARLRRRRETSLEKKQAPPRLVGNERFADVVLWTGAAVLFVYVIVSSASWEFAAFLMPRTLAILGLATIIIHIVAAWTAGTYRASAPGEGATIVDQHNILRVAVQGLWLGGLIVAIAIVGMLPALFLFVFLYMVVEGRMHWGRALLILLPFSLATFMLFHETLHVPWPRSYLGDWLPGLRQLVGGRIL
ncbi:MAG: tripartite tricarboxylate transporter permease [Alphaproteobacteria bacterium]|nr:tripartite tricarboxylate transporter permease [Alphaproteobacteria bacterium]